MTKEQCAKCEQRDSNTGKYCWWNGLWEHQLKEKDNEFWKNCDYKSEEEDENTNSKEDTPSTPLG